MWQNKPSKGQMHVLCIILATFGRFKFFQNKKLKKLNQTHKLNLKIKLNSNLEFKKIEFTTLKLSLVYCFLLSNMFYTLLNHNMLYKTGISWEKRTVRNTEKKYHIEGEENEVRETEWEGWDERECY